MDTGMQSCLPVLMLRGRMLNSLPVPVSVDWEVTKRCNQACVFCYNRSQEQTERITEASTDQLRVIVDKLADAGVFHLTLSGGEPLVRSDLGVLLDRAAQRNLIWSIVTNGVLLTPRRTEEFDRLNAHFRTFQVSMHGLSASSLEGIGIPQRNAEKVQANIRNLLRRGFPVTVHSVLTPWNEDDVCDVYRWCSDAGVYAFIVSPLKYVGRARGLRANGRRLSYTDWVRFQNKLFLLREGIGGCKLMISARPKIRRAFPERFSGNLVPFTCEAGSRTFLIKPDGATYPCPYMTLDNFPDKPWENQYSGGSILSQSVDDIWNGPGFTRFRRELMAPSSADTLYDENCRRCRFFMGSCVPCLITKPICRRAMRVVAKGDGPRRQAQRSRVHSPIAR
jgi:radical SAM protein with 4Fe4S-binding SPASM domain